MKVFCIYLITSPTGGKYVGLTSARNQRFYSYRHGRCQNQIRLFNSITKHGWEAHKLSILRDGIETKEEASVWERFYIWKHDTFRTKNGLNLTAGGHDANPISDEKRKEISEFMRGWMAENNPMNNAESREAMLRSCRSESFRRRHGEIMKATRKRASPVVQLDMNGVELARFESGESAANFSGLSSNKIRECCRNERDGTDSSRRKSHGGFRWNFAD